MTGLFLVRLIVSAPIYDSGPMTDMLTTLFIHFLSLEWDGGVSRVMQYG